MKDQRAEGLTLVVSRGLVNTIGRNLRFQLLESFKLQGLQKLFPVKKHLLILKMVNFLE